MPKNNEKPTQEYFIKEFECENMFKSRNSMRLSKEGHEILRKKCHYIKQTLQSDAVTILQESTLYSILNFPWFMERRRRTDRRGIKSGKNYINRYFQVIYFYGDRQAALFLKLLNGDLQAWTEGMTDSKIYRMILEPLPDINWRDESAKELEIDWKDMRFKENRENTD